MVRAKVWIKAKTHTKTHTMSEKSVLNDLIRVFEEHFKEAEIFQPRCLKLDEFVYINDEEVDKADELERDETVELIDRVGQPEDLTPVSKGVPLASIDAGSVRLGETDQGVLSAFRVAIVKQSEPKPSYELYGPYVLHITGDNKQMIYSYLRNKIFHLGPAEAPWSLYKMTDRIRNFLERQAQKVTAESIENGIVLWDGSLTGGTIDTPGQVLRESMGLAHSKGSSIVAVSKSSWLKIRTGERIVGLLEDVPRACYVDVHEQIDTRTLSRFLGRVHVVKFTPDGFSFRVDVAPKDGASSTEALGLLMGNSDFSHGYPELLRQAHIHAYFTPNEILALQNMAVDKYELKVTRAFDVRRCILAPFG